jgi:hypothetical protein
MGYGMTIASVFLSLDATSASRCPCRAAFCHTLHVVCYLCRARFLLGRLLCLKAQFTVVGSAAHASIFMKLYKNKNKKKPLYSRAA